MMFFKSFRLGKAMYQKRYKEGLNYHLLHEVVADLVSTLPILFLLDWVRQVRTLVTHLRFEILILQ
jgi:hypothetical protein